MKPFIIFYNEFDDNVYFLNKNENLIDTNTIYRLRKSEFMQKFNFDEETSEKWYFFAKPQIQHNVYLDLLNKVDNATIKYIELDNPVENLKPIPLTWLKIIIKDVVNEWLDWNLINVYNPLYIDVDKYVDKWVEEERKQLQNKN